MKFESARINEYSMHYDAHAYCIICGEHTTALCKCQIEIDSLVKEIEAMPTKLQLSWVAAVKKWNDAQAFKEDIYAIPRKGGESYAEVKSLRDHFNEEMKEPKVEVPVEPKVETPEERQARALKIHMEKMKKLEEHVKTPEYKAKRKEDEARRRANPSSISEEGIFLKIDIKKHEARIKAGKTSKHSADDIKKMRKRLAFINKELAKENKALNEEKYGMEDEEEED